MRRFAWPLRIKCCSKQGRQQQFGEYLGEGISQEHRMATSDALFLFVAAAFLPCKHQALSHSSPRGDSRPRLSGGAKLRGSVFLIDVSWVPPPGINPKSPSSCARLDSRGGCPHAACGGLWLNCSPDVCLRVRFHPEPRVGLKCSSNHIGEAVQHGPTEGLFAD